MQTDPIDVPSGAAAADERADMGEAATLGEPSDYAVVGREIRVLRLGPVHGRWDGERLVEVTDALCAELVRVFEHRRAHGDGVPIDWNHASEGDGPPEETGPLGEVLSLRHVPGDGLFATLGYSARGERVVRDASPALWTSPSFRIQPVFDKTTGERIGGAELRAIALTPFPRQDRTDAVRLSDTPADCRNGGPAMVDTATQSPAPAAGTPPAPVQAAEPEMDMKAMLAAKDEEIAMLKQQLAALMEKMGAYEEAEQAAASEGASLAEVSRKVATLAEQSRKLEVVLAEERKARASERLAHRLDDAEHRGLFAPPRRGFLVSLAEKAPDLFEAEMQRLADAPEVPLGEVGHGKAAPAKPADPTQAAHEAINAIMLAEKVDYTTAYGRLKQREPALVKGV